MSDGNIILIDIDIHSDDKRMKDKLKKFVENYKRHSDKLCKHLSYATDLPVPDSIGKYKEYEYENGKYKYENGKIYYLFDKTKTEIVAFAITSTDHYNITTLNWLCSSNNIDKKTTKMDGKPLGIYLLDHVYDKCVKEKNGILKIQPANEKLVSYYSNWKTPSLPSEDVGIIESLPDTFFNTGVYLVYFDKELDLSNEQINDCIYDIRNFEELCGNLGLRPYDVRQEYKTTESIKSYLEQIIGKLADPDYRVMFEHKLDTFNYCSMFQVQKELQKIYLEKINKTIMPKIERSIVLRTIDIIEDAKNGYKELKEFFKNFKIYYFSEKLCVDSSTPNSEPLLIPTKLSQYEGYTKIHYLFDENNEEIVAFAVINQNDPNNKITSLSYLCSSINIDKNKDKMVGKPLGIYLLYHVYDEYVNKNEGGVLKIEPANEKLVDYYSKWKTPSLPSIVEGKEVGIIKSKPDIIFDTGSYMVYFNKDTPLSDIQIERLIHNINDFEYICNELDLKPNDVLKIDKEKRKDFLHERAADKADKEYDYSETIDNIHYYTIDDIKESLAEVYKIKEQAGGEYKTRKTKKNRKRKNQKTRNQKCKKKGKTRKQKRKKQRRHTRRGGL